MLEAVFPCKTVLTVNAMAAKVINPSRSRSTWNSGACTHQDTADNYMKAGILCC